MSVMNKSRQLQVGCQLLIDLIFLSILIFLTVIAIGKYIQQPISTHTKYTLGDDDKILSFPQVLFCSAKTHLHLGGECGTQQGQESSLEFVHRCSKTLQNWNINEYFKNSSIMRQKLISEAYFEFNESRRLDVKNLFNPTFHQAYGPCIEFNGEQINTPVKFVNQRTMLNVTIDFSAIHENMNDGTNNTNQLVLFYAKNESLEVADNDVLWFLPKVIYDTKLRWQLYLKKRTTNRDSTRKSPCGKYGEKTCRQVNGHKAVAEALNCKLPFLNSQHLPEEVMNLQPCNDTGNLRQALGIFLNVSDECQHARACMRTRYTAEYPFQRNGIPEIGKTIYEIKYAEFEVKHEISTINYDLQSLICEIGGVIGMTLGFSGSSIGRAAIEFVKRQL